MCNRIAALVCIVALNLEKNKFLQVVGQRQTVNAGPGVLGHFLLYNQSANILESQRKQRVQMREITFRI